MGPDLEHISDDDLMRGLQSGDVQAFEVLVYRYRPRLEGFLTQRLGDRDLAQDFAQETFIRVYQEAREYIPMGRFRAWLYTIARNLCTNSFLSAQRHQALTPDAPLILWNWETAVARNSYGEEERDLRTREVQRASARLPDKQRRVVMLKYVDGLSISEIAELEGCPEGTVKSRLYHGMRRLREKLSRRSGKEVAGA